MIITLNKNDKTILCLVGYSHNDNECIIFAELQKDKILYFEKPQYRFNYLKNKAYYWNIIGIDLSKEYFKDIREYALKGVECDLKFHYINREDW